MYKPLFVSYLYKTKNNQSGHGRGRFDSPAIKTIDALEEIETIILKAYPEFKTDFDLL